MKMRTPVLAVMIVAGAATGIGLASVGARRAAALPVPAGLLAALGGRSATSRAAPSAPVRAAIRPAGPAPIVAPGDMPSPYAGGRDIDFADVAPGLPDAAIRLDLGPGNPPTSGPGLGPLPAAGPQAVSTVPDSATWLTMVAGLGLVGLNLRRRTTLRSVSN